MYLAVSGLAALGLCCVQLKWNAPDETGGEAITAYELMVAPQPVGWEGGPPDEQVRRKRGQQQG
jgi:hypothetical protein